MFCFWGISQKVRVPFQVIFLFKLSLRETLISSAMFYLCDFGTTSSYSHQMQMPFVFSVFGLFINHLSLIDDKLLLFLLNSISKIAFCFHICFCIRLTSTQKRWFVKMLYCHKGSSVTFELSGLNFEVFLFHFFSLLFVFLSPSCVRFYLVGLFHRFNLDFGRFYAPAYSYAWHSHSETTFHLYRVSIEWTLIPKQIVNLSDAHGSCDGNMFMLLQFTTNKSLRDRTSCSIDSWTQTHPWGRQSTKKLIIYR